MKRWLVLVPVLIAALGLATLAASSGDDGASSDRSTVRTENRPSCRTPLVTDLKARWGGERGLRIKIRVDARARQGRIIALSADWGDGVSGVYDLIARQWISLEFAHRYRRPGSHRVSVVAESSSRACGVMRSSPATLTVQVPVQQR